MIDPVIASPMYASATFRDRFLAALDARDHVLSSQLANHLTDCGNPLPGMTCQELGLPVGSTYGCAAKRILSRGSASE